MCGVWHLALPGVTERLFTSLRNVRVVGGLLFLLAVPCFVLRGRYFLTIGMLLALSGGLRLFAQKRAYPRWVHGLVMVVGAVLAWALYPGERRMTEPSHLQDFAARYTAAWCSQNAASVAAFYAPTGALRINEGAPSTGRAAITSAAKGFMTAFPDMRVRMDEVTSLPNGRAVYRWTLTGTNTGPGGTGKRVHIHGHEEWTWVPMVSFLSP